MTSDVSSWPSVGVVVPTYDRFEMVRRTIDAVLAQQYAGELRVVLVIDRPEVDEDLATWAKQRGVDVHLNVRTQGLSGARNTGILALDTELIAFCDDDDEWLPGKLTAQVTAMRQHPAAEFASTAIVVQFEDRQSPRLAGTSLVTYRHLLRSRMSMVHSSTFVMRRQAMLDGIGLVDETLPGSQNEDYDLLLRAAARQPIVHVDEPLVRVLWGRSSYFSRRWDSKIDSTEWMLEHHPAITTDAVGAARIYGQIAFAHACASRRGPALRWALRSLGRRPREWRAVAALVVASGAVGGEKVLAQLHRYGRGV